MNDDASPKEDVSPPAANLVRGPVLSKSLRYGLPLALGTAFHGLFNCVDLVILGRFEPGAVAAVTVAGIVLMLGMLLFNGLANVLAAKTAQAAGRHDMETIRRLAEESLAITWFFSAGTALVFYALADPLLALFPTDEATHAAGVQYLRIMALGSGTMFGILQTTAVLRGLGSAFWPLFALVTANLLNIVLDLALVFGLWGFPQLGVAGAAWATVIARGVVLIPMLWVLGSGQKPLGEKLSLWQWRCSSRTWKELSGEGALSSLQMSVRVVSLYILLVLAAQVVANQTGDDATGAQDVTNLLDGVGLAIRLEMVVVFWALGWGSAAASLVGQNMAAGFKARARNLCGACCLFAALGTLVMAFFAAQYGPAILALMAPEFAADALDEGRVYLQINQWFWGFLGVAVVLSQALLGLNAVKWALWLDSAIYLPLCLSLAYLLSADSRAVESCWQSLIPCHILAATAYAYLFVRRLAETSISPSRTDIEMLD